MENLSLTSFTETHKGLQYLISGFGDNLKMTDL